MGHGSSGFIPALYWLFFAVLPNLSLGQTSTIDRKVPIASQGSIGPSGKFVPANQQGGSPETRQGAEAWKVPEAKWMEKTGEHTFRIGLVHGDRAARTLTIPAQVNAREGLLEYALVTHKGKTHEALLTTDADPLHVQTAAMLLGMSPQPGKQPAVDVMVDVEWATNGPTKKVALEDLITLAGQSPGDAPAGSMSRGPWKFTGSQIDSGGFVAAREGSIIALIDDPSSLVANPRRDRQDDTLHSPQAAAMPGIGIPVTVRIRCQTPDAGGAITRPATATSSPENP